MARDNLGINSYGISVTTLEEVFLKVAEGGGPDDMKETQKLSREMSRRALERSRSRSGWDESKLESGGAGVGLGGGGGGGGGAKKQVSRCVAMALWRALSQLLCDAEQTAASAVS